MESKTKHDKVRCENRNGVEEERRVVEDGLVVVLVVVVGTSEVVELGVALDDDGIGGASSAK